MPPPQRKSHPFALASPQTIRCLGEGVVLFHSTGKEENRRQDRPLPSAPHRDRFAHSEASQGVHACE